MAAKQTQHDAADNPYVAIIETLDPGGARQGVCVGVDERPGTGAAG
jgi:hypothetical protein